MDDYLSKVTGASRKFQKMGFVKQAIVFRKTDVDGEAGGKVVQCITVRFTEDELPLTNEYIHEKVTQYD